MGTFILLLAAAQTLISSAQNPPPNVWEESPMDQMRQGYHPAIRLFNGSRFTFLSPGVPVQGRYTQTGSALSFTPETATELSHDDFDKIVADDPAEAKAAKTRVFEGSLFPFTGSLSPDGLTLTLNYSMNGMVAAFNLHPFQIGGAQSHMTLPNSESALATLWYCPDPFPQRTDSLSRFRVEGVDGLKKFAAEAATSDASQFGLLDVRRDHTFRMGSTIGIWSKEDGVLHLTSQSMDLKLVIAPDFQNLRSNGRIAFVRTG